MPIITDRPLRVTFVLPYAGLSGGIRVAAIYAERLRRRGCEVTVISQAPQLIDWRSSVRMLLQRGRWPRPRPARSAYFDGSTFTHRLMPPGRQIGSADAPDADVVIATWWETAEPVAALPPEKGAKVYFVQHHEVHDPTKAEAVRRTYRLPMRKIVISSWLAEVMAADYGDRDVDLVLNAVDHEQFHAPPRGRRPRPTVGLLYATKPFKGLDVALAALAVVRERLPNLDVVAFGAGAVRPDLPLPTGARYVQNPPQAQLRELYAACDVWLWSSHVEGFGLPIAEAMACRCPVVSTRVGAAIDLVEDGVSGRVTPPGDPVALAVGLLDVLGRDEAGWRAMSDAAHAQVRRYGWDDATALLEAALRRCAAAHAR